MDTLPPYNRLQVTAVALDASGTPLIGAPAPTFTTNDSSVRVSSTGLLTAREERSSVKVVATLVYRGIRLADTAVVNVTANATVPTFDHLVFGLLPGDSAKIALPNSFAMFYFPATKQLQTVAVDADGMQIPGSLVALRASDPYQATVPAVASGSEATVTVLSQSRTQVARIGPVTVYASATVYGVAVRDSVRLMITPSLLGVFFLQDEVTSSGTSHKLAPSFPRVIGRGGIVWWVNQSSDSLDIVFDHPTAASSEGGLFDAGGGNVPAFQGCLGILQNCPNVQGRKFLQAGTVHFHSLRTGVTGTIIVQ
jgi:hypothetical protein